MIQGCLIQVLLKNICCLKEVENQPLNCLSTGCFTLSVFEKNLKKLENWLTLLSSQFNRLFHVFNWLIFENP